MIKNSGTKYVRRSVAKLRNSHTAEAQICEKCGNDLSVDQRAGGCVSNYCPWCGTRKPKF